MAHDEALWQRWIESRDARAFEALVRSLQSFAYDFARRIARHDSDAEDLAQEALVELSTAGEKPGEVGLKAFLGRRISLGARMLRRASLTRARHERGAAAAEPVKARHAGPEVEEALALLDDGGRAAVELRFLHDLSYREIAHVLGITETNARVRVHRALSTLRARLGPDAHASIAALALFVPPSRFARHTLRTAAAVGGVVMVSTTKNLLFAAAVLLFAGATIVVARPARQTAPTREARSPQPMPEPAPEPVPVPVPDEDAAAEQRSPAARPIPRGKGSLAGRITFGDGTPLVDAELRLWGTPAVTAKTDAEGRFHIHGDWVSHRELCWHGDHGRILPLATARLEPDKLVQLDVVLERGHTLHGTLSRQRTREPLAGVELRFRRQHVDASGTTQASFAYVTTDAEGRYRLDHLVPGRYAVTAQPRNIEPLLAFVDVPAEGPADLQAQEARDMVVRFENLPPEWVGRRVIVDAYGDAGLDPDWERVIDANGEVHVEAPPPGKYVFTTMQTSRSVLPRMEVEVVVTKESVPDVVFGLPVSGRLEGTVLLPGRQLAGGFIVALQGAGQSVSSDAAGRYAFANAPAGEVRIKVEDGRTSYYFLRQPVVVKAGTTTRHDVELPGRAVLFGTIVADAPKWSKFVEIRNDDIIVTAGVDAHGAFRAPHLAEGTYRVTAFAKGAEHLVKTIVVGPGETDAGKLAPLPHLKLPATVTAPAGTKLAGRHDFYTGAPRVHRGQLVLDEAGRGYLTGLPRGRWTSVIEIDGARVQAEIEVRPGASVALTLRR